MVLRGMPAIFPHFMGCCPLVFAISGVFELGVPRERIPRKWKEKRDFLCIFMESLNVFIFLNLECQLNGWGFLRMNTCLFLKTYFCRIDLLYKDVKRKVRKRHEGLWRYSKTGVNWKCRITKMTPYRWFKVPMIMIFYERWFAVKVFGEFLVAFVWE